MAFTNRVRLPIKISKPQFIEDRQEYRKANGVTVTLSIIIRKVYEGITDSVPEKIHERLKIALAHDSVTIEGDKYVGVITQEADYQIEWSDFLDRPIAQGKFKANVSPFNATNSNCGTCEEYTQIVAVDDSIGTVDEGQSYDVDVLANDDACCSPVQLTIVTSNSDYVQSVTINVDNTLTIVIKTPVPDATGVTLVTYRAQCDNGQYDEANVIADVDGSAPACLAPTNLQVQTVSDVGATITWDQPVGATSYEWELFLLSDLGTPIQTGTSTTVDDNAILTGLTAATQYRLYVRSDCGSGNFSNYVYIDFITNPATGTDTCGEYSLYNGSFGLKQASYIDCNGDSQILFIPTLQTRSICALQYSAGNPVDITVQSGIVITYVDLC